MAVLSHAQLQALARQAGFPASHLALMSAIAMAESGGRTNAGGPSDSKRHMDSNNRWSVGLWQINTTDGAKPGTGRNGVSLSALEDPATNARVAYDIFKAQTLRAWGTYTNGAYKSHLAAAQRAAGGAPVTYDPPAGGGGAGAPAAVDSNTLYTAGAVLGVALLIRLIKR